MPGPLTNWAGNVAFVAARHHRPSSVDELRELVAAGTRVRALGTGHSFSDIADTAGDLISTAGLPKAIDVDTARAQVRVAGGMTYAELAPQLHAAGFALPNLGSLPHISVAGACATGTHGSGNAVGNLATAVVAMEVVTARGDLDVVEGDRLRASAVGLGALGVVTTLTLSLVPTFEMRQYVYEGLPLHRLYEHAAEIFDRAHSVSLFTGWNGSTIDQVWVKERADGAVPAAREWLGATLADGPRHPLPGHSPVNCTVQCGEIGPWYERLPHFRSGFMPSSGEELQSEYLVPRERVVDAVQAIGRVADRIRPLLHVSELRTVAADELWLSPSYRRDSLAIHFTWHKDMPGVTAVLPVLEEQLAPFGARPHWGKLFTIGPDELSARYERWSDFAALRDQSDPGGKFGNAWTDRFLEPPR